MKVMVTGANGYIGTHVVAELDKRGHEVVAVDLTESNFSRNVEFIQASLVDDLDRLAELASDLDVCIDLAWRNGFVHNADSHIQDLWSHYCFVDKMINGGLKHFVGMGSMHEIGYIEGSIDENTPCNPISKYGISKNALRQLITERVKNEDVIFQWIRGFYITGDDIKNHSIFSKIIQAEAAGEKLFPFTTGENQYDFLDINSLAEQIVSVSLQDRVNGIINCCSGKPVPLKVKVEEFIRGHNLKIQLDYGRYPDRPYDSPAVWGNPNKIKEILKGND